MTGHHGHRCRRSHRRRAAVLAATVCTPVVILGCQVGFGPEWSGSYAVAHDVVLDSTPADGATVEEFPREIVLEFSGIPRDSFNTVAVSDTTTATVLFSDEPVLENQIVRITVPDDIHPGPGEYTVGFQITSSDGHATRGRTTFTVSDGAAGASRGSSDTSEMTDPGQSADSTGSAESSPSVNTTTAVAVGGGLLLLLAAGLIIKKRK
ncbi:copper resistance protein CopC [Corynebacterium sp. CCM 9186]|uniref:copper resistance CopC family protein n=1 Tax=Corynebacterium meridianum TaxID=2765363 RepID=UPI0020058CDF|nr:copper resistance protein CopC [Corynebacterium meridianum]